MKKAIKWTLVIVPAIIILVLFVVFMRLDSIVKRVVETQATASTNLKTTLGSANLSLVGGNIALKDLQIGSPAGFTAPELFSLKGVSVQVSYSQLRDNPIRITDITVDNPTLVIEQKDGKLNVNVAMEQMPKSESSTMRLVIDTLSINNTSVVIRPGIPLLPAETTLTLPSITLRNIGTGEGADNGAAIKDVLKQVMAAMLQKVQESDKLPGDLSKWMTTNTEQLKEQLQQEAGKQLQGILDKNKQAATKAVDEGIKNLLGGSKKK